MNFLEYSVGDIVWYLNLNYLTGHKELVHGHVRTIYPTVLILTDEEDNSSHCISLTEADQIYRDEHSANVAYNSTIISAKYGG